MAQLFLFSNAIGTFAFNQNFVLIDKILFKRDEIVDNSIKIENGLIIEQERKKNERNTKASFSLIGFRNLELEENKKIKNILDLKIEYDFSKFARINSCLLKEVPDFFQKMKEANTLITKHKIRESVNDDILIIQAISNIVEMEKITNTMAKRLREWFSYYLPEFSNSISSHEKFAELVAKKKKGELLKEIGLLEKESMGCELKKEDVNAIKDLAHILHELYKLKERQAKYIESVMERYCPNISAVAGPVVGAKLLSKAGSLKKLAEFPSSTIQVLGAEEAFFRHLTKGTKPPKYGIIFQHPLMSKVKAKNRGKAARLLADKISIAAKVDYFKGSFIGDKLKREIGAKIEIISKGKEKEKAENFGKDKGNANKK
ncbi:MAG: hypothetical protein N3D84_00920 [Candidatus Woesearchaeota archaeon]|nr:hypothetical protein [Candidatus Woesearchaeota archaeon]